VGVARIFTPIADYLIIEVIKMWVISITKEARLLPSFNRGGKNDLAITGASHRREKYCHVFSR